MLYKLIIHGDVDEWAKEVDSYLRNGWVLHGAPFSHGGKLAQAIISLSVHPTTAFLREFTDAIKENS